MEILVYCGFELLVTFWVYNIGLELEEIWGVEILVFCGFELVTNCLVDNIAVELE